MQVLSTLRKVVTADILYKFCYLNDLRIYSPFCGYATQDLDETTLFSESKQRDNNQIDNNDMNDNYKEIMIK